MKRYRIETERADLFDVNMMVVMHLTIKGAVKREELESAFYKAVKAHGILNTRVVIEENGEAFYQTEENPVSSIYFSNKDINALIKENESRRFLIEEGEFIRLFVDDNLSDSFKLTFIMHHLAGDGKSLCYFIESFMTCLSGSNQAKGSEIFLLTRDNMPKGSRGISGLVARKLNKSWMNDKKVFGWEDIKKAFETFWPQNETIVELETVDKDKMDETLADCHKAGLGYTSFFIASEMMSKSGKRKIGLAVDGRMNNDRGMGNYATGISIDYTYKTDKDLLENAKTIDKAMKKKLRKPLFKYFVLQFIANLDPSLVDAANLQHVGLFDSKASRYLADVIGYGENTYDLSLTNLTKLDIPVQYGDYYIEDLYFIPPVVSYSKYVVGLISVNGKLHISRHYYK